MRPKRSLKINKITEILNQVERALIVNALRRANGRVSEAARELNVNRTDIYQRMLKLGIPKPSKNRPPLVKESKDLLKKFMGSNCS